MVIVAGGIGLAPLRPVVLEALARPRALRPGHRPVRRAHPGRPALRRRARATGGARGVEVRRHRRPRRRRLARPRRAWSPGSSPGRAFDPARHGRVRLRPRGDDAVRRRARCATAASRRTGSGCRWSATCTAASACAGTASSAPLLRLPGRPGLSATTGRAAARRSGSCDGRVDRGSRRSRSGSSPRATAASSRCSTARTSCWRWPARWRSPTSWRRPRAVVRGPVRPVAGRGLDHHARRRRAHPARSARSRASAGDHRRLRDRRRHPGAAQLRRRRRVPLGRLRPPRVHRDAGHLDADRRARPVDFELRGCPIDKAPAARGDHRLPARPPAAIAAHSVCVECKRRGNVCVMVAHGTPVPRPGHPRRLRRAVPGLRPRAATAASARWRRPTRRSLAGGCATLGADRARRGARLPHLQRRAPSRSARRARPMSRRADARDTASDASSYARPRRGRGRDARHVSRRRGRPTCSCGSTSRRASSRRSCAAAPTPSRPTSPRGSAGSARSPTR